MLYFLISFLSSLLFVFVTENIGDIIEQYNNVSNESIYIDYLFQKHYISYLYCKNKTEECESDKLFSQVDNYVPTSFINAPLQKEIYSCGTHISNNDNAFVLLTTFKRVDFFKEKVQKKELNQIVSDITNKYSVNMPISVFYTKSDMEKEAFFQYINACVNSLDESDKNIYFVSYYLG